MAQSLRVVSGACMVVAGMALAAPPTAVAAQRGFAANYGFPNGDQGFRLHAIGAAGCPCDLVASFTPVSEFNDAPPTRIILGDPAYPVLENPLDGGNFHIQFGIVGFGQGMIALPDAPNADGFTGFHQIIGGHSFDVAFQFGPGPVDRESWVGFDPQPDPPGVWFGAALHFPGDPFVRFNVRYDDQLLILGLVPEPQNLAMMIAGFGLLGATMRMRRRAKAVANA